MLNRDIRKTAAYILKTSFLPLTVLAAFNSLYIYAILIVNALTGDKKFIGIMAVIIILAAAIVPILVSVFSNYFHLYTWIFGKAQLSYLIQPLKNKKPAKSCLPLILLSAFLQIIALAVSALMLILWLLSLVINPEYAKISPKAASGLLLICLFVLVYVFASVKMARYVWAVKPEYSAFDILKRGFKYVSKYWQSWLWFTLTTNSIPIIIWTMANTAFNAVIATVIFIPLNAYINLTQAGYVYENILKFEFGNESAYSYAIKEITDSWKQ